MPMPTGSTPASPDRVWSIMLSQLERAALPREAAPQQFREQRYAVRLVQRGGHAAAVPEPAAGADIFDAMSCLLLACNCVGRRVNTQLAHEAPPLICFVTRQHAARVMARLAPVIASCNERLRDSPWEVVATRMDVH